MFQAEAQRQILERHPLEMWKATASYFAVAPSLPAHLFAEMGILGLLLWLSCLAALTAALIRARKAAARGRVDLRLYVLSRLRRDDALPAHPFYDRDADFRCREELARTPGETASPLPADGVLPRDPDRGVGRVPPRTSFACGGGRERVREVARDVPARRHAGVCAGGASPRGADG